LSYSGSSNTAAQNTMTMVIRPGWTTHTMNMGQRSLQLNNTYTVSKDGSILYHVAQMPPNANIFQPGPAFVFVTVNGIPSNGAYVIVGSGNIETQTMNPVDTLPADVLDSSANGSGSSNNSSSLPPVGPPRNRPHSFFLHRYSLVVRVVGLCTCDVVDDVCFSCQRSACLSGS
jgi:hypothetical protein